MDDEATGRDPKEAHGYSMPASLHARVEAEARARGWSRSFLVREAVVFWLKVHGKQVA
ncbi:MAG: hypothetical protein NVS1B6_08560 [Steroidobacteraceae bacterium]